ncbi:serine/threonine protein kinase [Streptomyces sp. NBC_00669]|uniref:serine/threonine-protein kinase n=1 Tax=Streptomyces sp. NBC_00669 TaxID=2976011 RepID=UPI002E309516|nr:serine/threonine-protein kinase [Streptomyces sp. NBC_00669]
MATNGGTGGQPEDEATRTVTSYELSPPGASEAAATPPVGAPSAPAPTGAGGTGGGRLVGERYRLVERLGFGGMGTVWRAHDEVVDRDVAVKEPRVPEHMTDAQRQTAYLRMQREARAAARIDHPSVVTVHDVVVEDDRPWIVMELVRGRSLAEVLAEGTVPAREAARIGLAVLGALVAAHEAGVLHRDVKPANILLGRHGRVVLTDFGIAHVEGEEPLTETGAFIGSPEYIAPERVLGQRPGPESDLWSLGVVLYQAVEGVSPFRRQATPSTFQAVLLAELPPPRAAGPLAGPILGVLRKESSARTTAARFGDELRSVLDPPRVPSQAGGTAVATAVGGIGGAGAVVGAGSAGGGGAVEPAAGRAVRALRRSRRAQAVTAVVVAVAVAGAVIAIVSPFGGGLPKGWKSYQERGVDATVAVPGDYVRSIADKKVTYTDPHGVFTVTLSKKQGEKDSAAGVANANLQWYKDGGQIKYSDTVQDADGRVVEATQQGQTAARLDVHYTDLSVDAHTAARELELDVVSGDGDLYTLDVVMPAAATQSAQGQRIFDQVKKHLTIHTL